LPIVKDTSYCKNVAADTLKVSPTLGNSLLWYETNLIGGTATKNAIKPNTLTEGLVNYYVSQASILTGCEGPKAKIGVTIYPLPNAPTLSRDTSGYLVASTRGISWYKDGSLIADTSSRIKPSIQGSYTVKTTQNGCTSSLSTPYYFLVTDIININAGEFIKLAPNPFINQLKFDFVVKGYQRLNLEVFDLATGSKKVSMQNLTPGMPINLSQLSAGTYVIKVISNDGKINYQFKTIKL
jgi:hypothetical protein